MKRSATTGRPLLVTMTGSECTGKTSLAIGLAEQYAAPWVPEAARAYAESKQGPLIYEDVEPIARAHIVLADEAIARAADLVVLDTDLLSTVVYSHHYYGACPEWVERAARERRADLYLLHAPDVPWLSDPSRDRGHMREEMHRLFREVLEASGARFIDIMGDWTARRAQADRAIEELLG